MATEKRLIDANKISYHKSGFPKGDGFDSGLDWAFREDIDKLHTVDAVEVVHGRWVPTECGTMCSACHRVYDNDFEIRKSVCIELKRCPDCGAKMDGADNG